MTSYSNKPHLKHIIKIAFKSTDCARVPSVQEIQMTILMGSYFISNGIRPYLE